MPEVYDTIGRTYAAHRRPDPRVAATIRAALGDARSVVNVGAGAGSYEPTDCAVVAVEPSWTMLDQRPPDAAPVVAGRAEALPFPDAAFDASLALLEVRAAFADLPVEVVVVPVPHDCTDGLVRLAADVESGAWRRRNRDLLEQDVFDAGYRLVVAG